MDVLAGVEGVEGAEGCSPSRPVQRSMTSGFHQQVVNGFPMPILRVQERGVVCGERSSARDGQG